MSENDAVNSIDNFDNFGNLIEEKYREILGEEHYSEYLIAINCYEAGIGIGSFIYLKRIIEMLLFDKFSFNKGKLAITLEEFRKLHFNDKIQTLNEFLPDILVENGHIYGIMSKPLHELSEEDCREIFPILQSGIELILDEILIQIKKARKREQFASFVSKTTKQL